MYISLTASCANGFNKWCNAHDAGREDGRVGADDTVIGGFSRESGRSEANSDQEHPLGTVVADPMPGNETMPRQHPGTSFYLIVTDRDSETFSVEGPMTDDRQWNHAVVVAQKSGRQVRSTMANGSSAENVARDWLQWYSGKQVPPGEIVNL